MANCDVELNIPGTGKCSDFFFLAPYARTTRYEEAFLPKGKKRFRSLRSLGLPHYNTCCVDFFFLILRRMGKKKAQAPTLQRIRYMSCFDVTHAPVATAARAAATGFVSMSIVRAYTYIAREIYIYTRYSLYIIYIYFEVGIYIYIFHSSDNITLGYNLSIGPNTAPW